MATTASGREYKCIVGKQDVSELALGAMEVLLMLIFFPEQDYLCA